MDFLQTKEWKEIKAQFTDNKGRLRIPPLDKKTKKDEKADPFKHMGAYRDFLQDKQLMKTLNANPELKLFYFLFIFEIHQNNFKYGISFKNSSYIKNRLKFYRENGYTKHHGDTFKYYTWEEAVERERKYYKKPDMTEIEIVIRIEQKNIYNQVNRAKEELFVLNHFIPHTTVTDLVSDDFSTSVLDSIDNNKKVHAEFSQSLPKKESKQKKNKKNEDGDRIAWYEGDYNDYYNDFELDFMRAYREDKIRPFIVRWFKYVYDLELQEDDGELKELTKKMEELLKSFNNKELTIYTLDSHFVKIIRYVKDNLHLVDEESYDILNKLHTIYTEWLYNKRGIIYRYRNDLLNNEGDT